MDVGNVDIFLESCTIASACMKVLRKWFLKPETVGLIPRGGGYSGNQNYSAKALMWILHMEQTDGCTIMHARNGREFRLPELPCEIFRFDLVHAHGVTQAARSIRTLGNKIVVLSSVQH